MKNTQKQHAAMDTRQPRKPVEAELRQLTQFSAQHYGYSDDPVENEKEAADLVSQAYIAVFDNYITGCPGYAGKVMVVVWDGSPTQYEAYIWENTNLKRLDKD